MSLLVEPPAHAPWYLYPALWITRRITGKDPLPARLLARFPKGAVGAGVFEALAAHSPRDLDGRVLAAARIVASRTTGCPFCLDMNAASRRDAGLEPAELRALLSEDEATWDALGEREAIAARWARALSSTPVVVPAELEARLRAAFEPREIVVLAHAIAQVAFWSRFNQALGVPAAGFHDDPACPLPAVEPAPR